MTVQVSEVSALHPVRLATIFGSWCRRLLHIDVAEMRVAWEHVDAVTMWGVGETPGEIPGHYK